MNVKDKISIKWEVSELLSFLKLKFYGLENIFTPSFVDNFLYIELELNWIAILLLTIKILNLDEENFFFIDSIIGKIKSNSPKELLTKKQ